MLDFAYNESVVARGATDYPILDLSADEALADELDGMVALTFQNERPLAGLAGLLDWRLHGAISSCIRAGAITGAVGECVYFPYSRHGKTYHLILAGAGYSETPGGRGEVPEETFEILRKNLKSLSSSEKGSVLKLGVSRADFGGADEALFKKHLKGAQVWIVK